MQMGKLGCSVVSLLAALIGADQYLCHGYYTDATILMLRQIRNSFGW
jgi:hypothetical protein